MMILNQSQIDQNIAVFSARYRLYHLVEDDWLTYYATRIAVNLNAALAPAG